MGSGVSNDHVASAYCATYKAEEAITLQELGYPNEDTFDDSRMSFFSLSTIKNWDRWNVFPHDCPSIICGCKVTNWRRADAYTSPKGNAYINPYVYSHSDYAEDCIKVVWSGSEFVVREGRTMSNGKEWLGKERRDHILRMANLVRDKLQELHEIKEAKQR